MVTARNARATVHPPRHVMLSMKCLCAMSPGQMTAGHVTAIHKRTGEQGARAKARKGTMAPTCRGKKRRERERGP
eukprot:9928449-Alexandrium_andersonii.AAC.1